MEIDVVFKNEYDKKEFEKYITINFNVEILRTNKIFNKTTCTYKLTKNTSPGRKPKITFEDYIFIVDKHRHGKTYDEIAKELGVTTRTIRNAIKKYKNNAWNDAKCV